MPTNTNTPVKLLNTVVEPAATTAGATTTVAATTTVFDPCATKTVGQACDGTTALYAGTYGGYKYMTTPSDQPSSTWGPNGETGITGKTDGAANTAALLAL